MRGRNGGAGTGDEATGSEPGAGRSRFGIAEDRAAVSEASPCAAAVRPRRRRRLGIPAVALGMSLLILLPAYGVGGPLPSFGGATAHAGGAVVGSAPAAAPLGTGAPNASATGGRYGWMLWNRTTDPPARTYASMGDDPAEGGVVLFGGIGSTGQPLNDTWVFRNGTWTELCSGGTAPPTCPASPPAVELAAMAYDPASGRLLLFGGYSASTLTDGNQTWALTNGSWQNLTGAVAPPPLDSPSMAYDPATGSVVLAAGSGGTWSFAHDRWSKLSLSAGSTRIPIGFAFENANRSGLVVWDTYNDTTWELVGGAWAELHPAESPGSYTFLGGADDTEYGYGLVVVAASRGNSSTWIFSNATWVDVTSTVGSEPGNYPVPALAYDSTDGYSVFFEQLRSLNGTNETWVLHDPLRLTLGSTRSVADVGQTLTYTVSVIGGMGPYDLELHSVPLGCVAPSPRNGSLVVPCAPTQPGEYLFNVSATDRLGTALSVELSLTVSPSLTVSVSVSVAPNPTTVGVPVSLDGATSGGSAPVEGSWTITPGNDTPNATRTGTDVTYTFGAPRSYEATFEASDAAGAVQNRTVEIAVYSAVALTAEANRTVVDAGMSVSFTANASGGRAPLSYAWEFGDGGAASTSAPEHTYVDAGHYNATVWANDTADSGAVARVAIEVNPTLSVTAEANVTRVGLYAPVRFSGRVTGGTGPYTYWWDFGNAGMANTATAVHGFTVVGNQTVELVVNDSVGSSQSSRIEIDVVGAAANTLPPQNGTTSNGVPAWEYAVGVGAGVLVVAGIVVAGVRWKRRP